MTNHNELARLQSFLPPQLDHPRKVASYLSAWPPDVFAVMARIASERQIYISVVDPKFWNKSKEESAVGKDLAKKWLESIQRTIESSVDGSGEPTRRFIEKMCLEVKRAFKLEVQRHASWLRQQ